jgi:hypothetical protein
VSNPEIDDPDLQLQFALVCLASYKERGDQRDLRRAAAIVRQVLARSRHGLAPHAYPVLDQYNYRINGPWYSAQTQGLLLSALTRLHTATGANGWLRRSHAVFDTLTTFKGFSADGSAPPDPALASKTDDLYLWFDRFAGQRLPVYDVQSHMFAMFGLYDFWSMARAEDADLTRANGAAQLLDGASSSLSHYLPDIRVPGQVARTNLAKQRVWLDYLSLREQLPVVARMFHRPRLNRFAESIRKDADAPVTPKFVISVGQPRKGVDPYGPGGIDASANSSGDSSTPIAEGSAPEDIGLYIIGALEKYRETKNRAWLTKARRAGRQALGMPNAGLFAHKRSALDLVGDKLAPPWYSAYTQGLMLSAFVRLYEATGQETWRAAADSTFFTLFQFREGFAPATPTKPWVSFLTDDKFLWFEQYPASKIPSYVVHAHVATAFAVYDYWDMTGNRGAALLFRGAATSVVHYLPLIRNRGTEARYRLGDSGGQRIYHRLFVRQLRVLGRMTGEPSFGRRAAQLETDVRD